jgi:hypothetical protein
LLNKQSVGPFKSSNLYKRRKDFEILGDLIECIEKLVNKLGWQQDLDDLMARHSQYMVFKRLN